MIRLRRLIRRFDSLSWQQHTMVVVISLLVVATLWFVGVGGQQHALQEAEESIIEIEKQIDDGEKSTDALRQELVKISSQALLEREATLQRSIEGLRSQLGSQQMSFGGGGSLEEVLNGMLEQPHGLHVVGMLRLNEEDLSEQERERVEEFSTQSVVVAGVQLDLQGGFRRTLEFFQAVESMEENFLWGSMRYVVAEYPDANIQLRLFVVSGSGGANLQTEGGIS